MGTKAGTPGYVYIIKADEDTYKIGFSSDVPTRLRELTALNPKAELIASMYTDDERETEKRFHTYFKNFRFGRELFSLTPDRLNEALTMMNIQPKKESVLQMEMDVRHGMLVVFNMPLRYAQQIDFPFKVLVMSGGVDGGTCFIPVMTRPNKKSPSGFELEKPSLQFLRDMAKLVDSFVENLMKRDSSLSSVSPYEEGTAGKARHSVDMSKTGAVGGSGSKKQGVKTGREGVSKLSVGGSDTLKEVREAKAIIDRERRSTQLATLKDLREKDPKMSISALAKALGVSRGTIHNLLHAVSSEGDLLSFASSEELHPKDEDGE